MLLLTRGDSEKRVPARERKREREIETNPQPYKGASLLRTIEFYAQLLLAPCSLLRRNIKTNAPFFSWDFMSKFLSCSFYGLPVCVCVIAVEQLGIKQSWDKPNIPGKNILKLKIHQNALPDVGFFYVFFVW